MNKSELKKNYSKDPIANMLQKNENDEQKKFIIAYKIEKIISLIFLIFYFIIFLISEGFRTVFWMFLFLSIPLSFIWFSDVMSRYLMNDGSLGLAGAIIKGPSENTPGIVGKIIGWILFLSPLALLLIDYFGIGEL